MTVDTRSIAQKLFVSYSSSDQDAADWAGQTLEAAGYQALLYAWDFRGNVIAELERAVAECPRMVWLASASLIKSRFCALERQQCMMRDPGNALDSLLIFRLENVELPLLLQQYVYDDLFGLDAPAAVRMLLARVGRQRRKPIAECAFPSRLAARSFERFPRPPWRLARKSSMRTSSGIVMQCRTEE